ncbi:MAG: hypothetical protein FWG87_00855 [Defluviitaleaceae bacterium]|nr:hypothetical protein [Defluviitaleaceae bacterium]
MKYAIAQIISKINNPITDNPSVKILCVLVKNFLPTQKYKKIKIIILIAATIESYNKNIKSDDILGINLFRIRRKNGSDIKHIQECATIEIMLFLINKGNECILFNMLAYSLS